ncbi:MAG: flagellar hook-basal body complex protein [Selenomonas bovis]
MAAKATETVTYKNNLNASVASIVSMTGGTAGGSTKTYTTDGASTTASTGTPLTLTVKYPDGTTEKIVKTEGTYAVGGTQSRETHTTTGSATSSADTDPVIVTLKNTKPYTVSTVNANMKYGFTTDTPGETVTASLKQQVTLYYDDNGTPTIIPALTTGSYTVGGTYQGAEVTTGTVTASPNSPLVLKLDDGTEHTVTSGTYEIGTDTYTYPGTPGTPVTATVTGASHIYTIQKMDVMTLGGGRGTTVQVGGFAEESSLNAATADANTTVIINGSVTKTSGSYTVGGTYTGDEITTIGSISDAATADKGIRLTLEDGTTATGAIGKTYKVGESYTYTTAGGTPTTTKIKSFAYTGTVTSLATRSDIAAIDYVEKGKITQIEEPSQLIASSENPVTLTLSDGTSVQETTGSYQKGTSLPITTTATIYDSLGGKHEATLFFTKMGVEKDQDGNPTSKWAVSLDLDHTASGAESTATIKDENGNLTTLTMPVGELVFNSSGAYVYGSGILELKLTNGAGSMTPVDPTQPADSKKPDTQTVSVNLLHLTQYVSGNKLVATGDGNAAGTLSSVSVDSSGIITGTYTNGIKQTEAQVAVAQFTNASGLTKTGNSLYQESNNSGTANVKTAADLGVKITPSALEMSNVDIANEFSDMIITQRGFQSNSKIITVGDEMLETLINMKR